MPKPIQVSGASVDLSPRIAFTTTVVGSPAAAAETVVAQIITPSDLVLGAGIILMGWLAYTIGATATSCQVRLRQGVGIIGTIVANSGAMTGGHNTAGQLVADDINASDTSQAAGASSYCMTLQVAGGSGVSTVSSVWLLLLAA